MSFSQTGTEAIQDLSGDYQIDPAHTRLGFVARHAMVTKVRGSFGEFAGVLHIDKEDPSRSSVEVTVQVASLTTGQEQRDAHLLSPDFLDVQQYPTLTFRSTSVDKVSDDRIRVTGDLTIKAQTRPVTLEFEITGTAKDPYGNLRAGFEGRGEISRKEWGLSWNVPLETGGFLVSNKIVLEIDVSAVKLTPTP